MNYKPYPTSSDTPSRKARKGSRRQIFEGNKRISAVLRKERRDKRRAEKEALENDN